MTKAEWRKIQDNMTRAKVKRIVGINGHITMRGEFSDGEIWTDVDYRQCKRNGTPASRWNTVTLSYTNAYYNPYDQDDYTLYFGAHRVDYKGGWFNPS